MRVTNSMLVNNLMRNLNNNLTNLDRLANQEASGRKYAHISDDPIAFLYSSAARNRLQRLDHYQASVDDAQDWLKSAESSIRDLQERIADVYTSLVNASTDVNNSTDKTNIAVQIAQLRDHYLDTLNSTFGDKYLFSGYNTPGEESQIGTGGTKITGPFVIDDNWNLFYNGQNMSNFLELQIGGDTVNPDSVNSIFGGLNLNINNSSGADAATNAQTAIAEVNRLIGEIADYNDDITDYQDTNVTPAYDALKAQENLIISIENDIARYDYFVYNPDLEQLKLDLQAANIPIPNLQRDYNDAMVGLNKLIDERQVVIDQLSTVATIDRPITGTDNMVSISLGGIFLLESDGAGGWNTELLSATTSNLTALSTKVDMVNTLKTDVLTFDVGPAVNMAVTFNGIDLVLFETTNSNGAYGTINILNLLHDIHKAASSGESLSNPNDIRAADLAENLGLFISELQQSQNHLLMKVAEIGGRTRRLDLLTSRYEADFINYTQMQSDAEDVDMAEVIMYLKMAEAVYQASLSAGARIIQPTLMDFLK